MAGCVCRGLPHAAMLLLFRMQCQMSRCIYRHCFILYIYTLLCIYIYIYIYVYPVYSSLLCLHPNHPKKIAAVLPSDWLIGCIIR